MAEVFAASSGKLFAAVSGVVPDSMFNMPDLAVSDNTAKIGIGAYSYFADASLVTGTAATGITAGSGTITAAKFATIRLEITANGTIAAGTKSSSYATSTLALAALPDVTTSKMSMGYYLIESAATTVTTLGTTKLSETAAAGSTAMVTFYEEFERAYVGDFAGQCAYTFGGTEVTFTGQDVMPSGSIITEVSSQLSIGEVAFHADSWRKLWGATHNPADTLKGGGNAYSWKLTADTRPVVLQLLFDFINSETLLREQIYCPKAKALSLPGSFGSKGFSLVDMTWSLLMDDDRECIYWYKEKG